MHEHFFGDYNFWIIICFWNRNFWIINRYAIPPPYRSTVLAGVQRSAKGWIFGTAGCGCYAQPPRVRPQHPCARCALAHEFRDGGLRNRRHETQLRALDAGCYPTPAGPMRAAHVCADVYGTCMSKSASHFLLFCRRIS